MQEHEHAVLDPHEWGLRKYIAQHALPHPTAVWVFSKSDEEISVEQVREIARHFDADASFDGTKFVIRPVSPLEASLLIEKAEDAGFNTHVDGEYYVDEVWPPRGALPTEHLMYAIAEIATSAWCLELAFGPGPEAYAETVEACNVLFRHLGWNGHSSLRTIVEVASDGLSVPDGSVPFPEPLSDKVRRIITPLVREAGEIGREEKEEFRNAEARRKALIANQGEREGRV